MHKVDALATAIQDGRVPKRKVYVALIDAMGAAFRHGFDRGVRLMRGRPDRDTLAVLAAQREPRA